jgi:hypothetical protein
VKNIIVTIGSEKLFIHGSGLWGGPQSDILQLFQRAVRVESNGNWREPGLVIHSDQNIGVELTTLDLPAGEVVELAGQTKLAQTEKARDQYYEWWSSARAKETAEKKRADELQKKLDDVSALLPSVTPVVQE